MNVPANQKYLLFVAAADNACMIKADEIRCINCDADGKVEFFPATQGISGDVSDIEVTIAADGEKAFFEALVNEIAFGNSAVIVVADEVGGSFFGTGATGTTITRTS
tara:strand:+ start:1603 stop:1923 length:321 start_codon:yes stop_codon:yes gene_type:complete